MAQKVYAVRPTDAVIRLTSHAPNANTVATKTITCSDNEFAVIWSITASYTETPTVATSGLKVTPLLNDEDFEVDIPAAIPFVVPGPLYGDVGDDLIITLEDPGNTALGKINVSYSIHKALG